MRGRGQVVQSLWRDLLPTAFLLTGDQSGAQHLLVRALSPGRRRPTDHDSAVTALVRTHHRRRRTGTGRIIGDLPTPWWASPDDVAAARELATHLDALDRDHRTATVLHWHEDWDAARTTALLPHVDLGALARRFPPDLPRRLETLAGLCDTTALDDDTVVRAVRATSARRARSTLLGAVAVLGLAAAAIWVPDPPPRSVAAEATPQAARTTSTAPLTGIYALPPRGSLLDDDLTAGFRRRIDAEGLAGDEYRIVYGEDVDAVRVVLMFRPVGNRIELAWLTGRSGSRPADLVLTRDEAQGPAGPSAAAMTVPDPDGGSDTLVVLTEDGDDVLFSPGVDVDPVTGRAGRAFVELPTTDGVAAVDTGRTTGAGVRLRVVRPGAEFEVWPTSTNSADVFMPPDPSGPPLPSRSGAGAASAAVVDAALSAVVAATGWAEDDMQVVVLGAGTLPGTGGETIEVAGVAFVLPSGAVITTTAIYSATDEGGSSSMSWGTCGSSGHPAGTDLGDLVVAATCFGPASPDDATRTAVVFAPRGHRVVLGYPDGTDPVEPDLDDGFGTVSYVSARDLSTASDGDAVVPVAGPAQDVLAG